MPETDRDHQRQREAVQHDLEAQLKEGLARIEELKRKADKADGRARITYNALINELWDQQLHLRLKVDGLKRVGARVWAEMKAGVDEGWSQLKTALEKASERIR